MSFPAEGFQFLRNLSRNNNRDWFQGNKQQFQEMVQEPVETLATILSGMLGQEIKSDVHHKVFRIYRDVRFSKDKTPYNTHMRIGFWRAESAVKKPMAGPAFYLSFEPEQVHCGAGCMQMPSEVLTVYREAVAQDGDKTANLLQSLEADGVRFDPPALKRVPAGYDKNHKHEALLRRKGVTGWLDRPVDAPENIEVQFLLNSFKRLFPIYSLMANL